MTPAAVRVTVAVTVTMELVARKWHARNDHPQMAKQLRRRDVSASAAEIGIVGPERAIGIAVGVTSTAAVGGIGIEIGTEIGKVAPPRVTAATTTAAVGSIAVVTATAVVVAAGIGAGIGIAKTVSDRNIPGLIRTPINVPPNLADSSP
jgi:hypothetical protein